MGNEASHLKDPNFARRSAVVGIGGGVSYGKKISTRRKDSLKELQKVRSQEKELANRKSMCEENRDNANAWVSLKSAVDETIDQAIVKPFQKMTGLTHCVERHCEDDDDEVVTYVYVKDSQRPGQKTVKQKVREMVNEANKQKKRETKEYLAGVDSD